MSHSFAPIFAWLRSTREFVVIRAYVNGKLEVFTDQQRLLVSPDELLFV